MSESSQERWVYDGEGDILDVDYQTVPESATAGDDFETAAGTVDFAPGETAQDLPCDL